MRTGIEILFSEKRKHLEGRRIGLIVNPTSVNARLEFTVDLWAADPALRLVRLFGPEHGVRGDLQDMVAVEDQVDARTGLPVVSLYGEDETSLKPAPEHLEDLDVLVFDIQDIGTRYYTFVYTLAHCMEAAGEADIPLIVCDRPNPITGTRVEGNLLDPAFSSFVGRYPLPIRHGMTVGELARYFQAHCGVACDLVVIEMEGWRRTMWYDETGLPWVQPSPNMPTLETALLYPGMCLVEGTNVSEGRGTTRPFHLVGAPWVDPHALAHALNAEDLPGVRWRPAWFTPMFHKHAGTRCAGVETHVMDRDVFKPVLAGLALLKHLRRLHPDTFRWRTDPYEFVSDRLAIDLLGGGPGIRQGVELDIPLEDFEATWAPDLEPFLEHRSGCLLYAE